MLQPVNVDDELVAARLLDFFTSSTPWHRALWNPGLALTLRELLEASEAVRAGVLSEDTLKSLGSSCLRLSGPDPGAGDRPRLQVLQQTLQGRLRYDGLDFHTLSTLAAEIEGDYLKRWANAFGRCEGRPKPERTARCVAAHLLDLGFSSDYLHRWWKFRLEHEQTPRTLADIAEEAHGLARKRPQTYQVLVVLLSHPRTRSGYPRDWLDAARVSHWLKENGFEVAGVRPSGGLVLNLEARDPGAASQVAGEVVDSLLARASVGTGDKVEVVQKAWVAGEKEPFALTRRLRGVRVRALYRENQVYPCPNQNRILDAAIELLSHLESSSPSAAVAGGWAAIEALLSEPNDRGSAAERLAALVACSFPRAELTVLSYVLEKADPSLSPLLAQAKENRDRAAIVARVIHAGQALSLAKASDRAAAARMQKLLRQPRKTLEDIKAHVTDAFARLYRQRNLVLHWGKTDAIALRASLRTAAPLVGAGMDRIAHGWYVNNVRPIELAARARVSLATVPDNDIGACVSLLG